MIFHWGSGKVLQYRIQQDSCAQLLYAKTEELDTIAFLLVQGFQLMGGLMGRIHRGRWLGKHPR